MDRDVHLPKKNITGNESKDGPDENSENSGAMHGTPYLSRHGPAFVYDFHVECGLVLVIVWII